MKVSASPPEFSKDVQTHIRTWEGCRACPLGGRAHKHCLFSTLERDWKPVDVLFLGEGPGRSEDALGEPFIGKSGRFFRQVISSQNMPVGVNIGFTNVVACRPQNRNGGEDRPPVYEEALACSGRLKNLIELVKPQIVVAVGRTPDEFLHLCGWQGVRERIGHPSHIVRTGCSKSRHYKEWTDEIYRILRRCKYLKEEPHETPVIRFRPRR